MTDGRETVSERLAPPSAAKSEGRRLALLKRMGLVGENTLGYQITRAAAVADLMAAYRLVHDAFVERGYLLPRPCRMRLRCYEALPEMATFVATLHDEVIGVQSLVVDSPDVGLPSDLGFRAEIDVLRGQGRQLCEATNEAVAPAHRKTPLAIDLMRVCLAQALFTGCRDILTTVSPSHVGFYELLWFDQISPVHSYSAEINDPVVVMRFDCQAYMRRFAGAGACAGQEDSLRETFFYTANPYRNQVEAWEREARRLFADPELLRELFVRRGHLLSHCNDNELAAIRQRWGDEVFARVWSQREVAA